MVAALSVRSVILSPSEHSQTARAIAAFVLFTDFWVNIGQEAKCEALARYEYIKCLQCLFNILTIVLSKLYDLLLEDGV